MLQQIKAALSGTHIEPAVIEEEEVYAPDPETVRVNFYGFGTTTDLETMHWASSGSVWTPNTTMLGRVLEALHEKGYRTSLTRHRDGTNTVNFSF